MLHKVGPGTAGDGRGMAGRCREQRVVGRFWHAAVPCACRATHVGVHTEGGGRSGTGLWAGVGADRARCQPRPGARRPILSPSFATPNPPVGRLSTSCSRPPSSTATVRGERKGEGESKNCLLRECVSCKRMSQLHRPGAPRDNF